MDERQFDSAVRALAAGANRRTILGGLAAGVGGWLAPFTSRVARARQGGCEGGLIDCGGVCVDTSSDPSNCGGCGVACGEGGSCAGGMCSVGVGVGVGTCANTCPAPYVQDPASCQCFCPAGLTDCGGACVDASSEAANCGGCGVVCPSGGSCVGGSCVCPAGTEPCGIACVPACGAPLVLDQASCNCSCPPLECGAGQTFDEAACACVDSPATETPEATVLPTPPPTTTPEAEGTATLKDAASSPTAGGIGVAPTTTAPDVTPTATPTGSADLVIRICWVLKDGQKLCVEFEIKGRGQAATANAVVISESDPPTRLEVTQGAGPAGFATVVQFSDVESTDPLLRAEGTITPDGNGTLRFINRGIDYLVDSNGSSGDVTITAGQQTVTGTFNPSTGLLENLSGEIPALPLSPEEMSRVMALQPAFATLAVASETGHRMQVSDDDFCLPRPFGSAEQTASLGGGIALVMGAGCCLADTANCAACQTASAALSSAFSAAG